jgi:hypothetical protein
MKLRNDGPRLQATIREQVPVAWRTANFLHQAVSRVDVFLRRAKHLALRSASIGLLQVHKSPCARSLFLRFRRDLDHEDDIKWSNRE